MIEKSGARVLWDVDVDRNENGSRDPLESEVMLSMRRFFFGKPLTATYSHLLVEPTSFQSKDIRDLVKIGKVESLAFDQLAVDIDDIKFLLERGIPTRRLAVGSALADQLKAESCLLQSKVRLDELTE